MLLTEAGVEAGFRPSTGQAALDFTGAIDAEWTPVSPEDVAQYFSELPVGAEVRRRVYAQLGPIFEVTAPGNTIKYMLEHNGNPDFPNGRAIETRF